MSRLILIFLAFTAPLTLARTPPKKLVIVGDSLTEGYGVSREAAFPALLEKRILAAGRQWQVVNSGISGSTTASAPSRIRWVVKQKPDLVLLALGANDGLRGLPAEAIEKNLREALDAARQAKIKTVLAGMKLPPNYGATYRAQFEKAFDRVAKSTGVPFIPFLLEGVGGEPAMNLADGIHPNEKGHIKIADTVFNAIKGLL